MCWNLRVRIVHVDGFLHRELLPVPLHFPQNLWPLKTADWKLLGINVLLDDPPNHSRRFITLIPEKTRHGKKTPCQLNDLGLHQLFFRKRVAMIDKAAPNHTTSQGPHPAIIVAKDRMMEIGIICHVRIQQSQSNELALAKEIALYLKLTLNLALRNIMWSQVYWIWIDHAYCPLHVPNDVSASIVQPIHWQIKKQKRNCTPRAPSQHHHHHHHHHSKRFLVFLFNIKVFSTILPKLAKQQPLVYSRIIIFSSTLLWVAQYSV